MSLFVDRVYETTVTTGTGAITMAGAVLGYFAWADKVPNPSIVDYVIVNAATGEVEVGRGTWTTTLARDTVISSSNANALVNFGAGTKDVFLTALGSSLIPTTLVADVTVDLAGFGLTVGNEGESILNITSANSGGPSALLVLDATGGTLAAPTIVPVGAVMGLFMRAWDGVGYLAASELLVSVTAVGGASDITTSAVFQLANGINGNVDVWTADGADLSMTFAGAITASNLSGTNTGDQTNITGNAATVTTNANLTGHVTSTGNAAVLGSFTLAQLNAAISDGDVGTGDVSGTAVSVDNELTRYNGTTGKSIQGGNGVILSDIGNITFPANASSSVPSIDFGSGNGWTYFSSGLLGRAGSALACYIQSTGYKAASNGFFQFTNGAGDPTGTTDSCVGRGGVKNTRVYAETTAAAVAGGTTSRWENNKLTTAIADNTATTIYTVTVPNTFQYATIEVEFTGTLGAGGAVGAGEASGTITYKINVTRVAGVNAVAAISVGYGAATTALVGATIVTVTAALGAMAGAVGAANTFTIQVTIAKLAGSSANHTCLSYIKVLNANSAGVTVA